MKRKWVYIVLLLLVLYFCFKRQDPIVEGVITHHSGAIEEYLSDSIWEYDDGKQLIFINSKSKKQVKMEKNPKEDLLGKDATKTQVYYVDFYEKGDAIDRYPYLVIGNKRYDFLVIKEDLFTLKGFDGKSTCTFTRKEKGKEPINGRYNFEGEIYKIYYSSIVGTVIHEETEKCYKFTELDSERLKMYDPVFSEDSAYRWWEDEEGNLCLLSESYDFRGLSSEEILQTFPVIVLEKID